ncbi:unnamed protein product, partial [Polarella glacialis]
MRGCDEFWKFGQSDEEPLDQMLSVLTDPDPGIRFKCIPQICVFAALCSQSYVVRGLPWQALLAQTFAAHTAHFGNDCPNQGLSDVGLPTEEILFNYARTRRLISQAGGGRLTIEALAWRSLPAALGPLVRGAASSGPQLSAPGQQLDDSVPSNFPGGRAAQSRAAEAGTWVCGLTSCREQLPKFLAGALRSSVADPALTAEAEAAQQRLTKLVEWGSSSECHRLSQDDVIFLKERVDVLRLSGSGVHCSTSDKQVSSWSPDGTLQVLVPESASWEVTTLSPLPYSTLELLLPERKAELASEWFRFEFESAGAGQVNMTANAIAIGARADVHGLHVRIKGLEETRCASTVELHVRAHRLGPDLLAQRAEIRAGLVKPQALLNLVVIVLDSTPAPSWDVFSPKLMRELDRFQGFQPDSSHESFRLRGMHALLDPACDCLTQDNMMTLFSGAQPPRKFAESRRVSGTAARHLEDLQKIRFMWDELKDRGYVTLSADDSCSRSPLNVADPEYKYFDTYAPTMAHGLEECSQEIYCRYSELMDYASQWHHLHAGVPRMAYLHFDGTHGTCPEKLVRYDTALTQFLLGLLSGPDGDRTAVLIMSDHGVQSGDGHLTSQPFSAAWLPRALLKTLGGEAVSALRGNENRLMTPYDLHFTLMQLLEASWDQARGVKPSPGAVRSVSESSAQLSPGHVIRSALRPMPGNRSCEDAGIHDAYCFCDGPTAFSPWRRFSGSPDEAHSLALQLVDLVNNRSRSNLLSDNKDMSACRLQSLVQLEGIHERTDGSLAELVATTGPFGLLWKAIARRRSAAAGPKEHGWRGGAGPRAEGPGGSFEVQSVEQITRYFPHEHCTVTGVDP